MDISSILENAKVKELLKSVGVKDDQVKGIADQAMSAIKGKFAKDPKQMSSLLSDNPNTPEDESLQKEVEEDFFQKITSKVGLSEDVAGKVKGAVPDIMKQFSQNLSASGANSESGISGIFDQIKDLFDGDIDNDGKPDEGGILGGLKKKFFG